MMKRREFITLLGGAAASWPLAARAEQPTIPVIGLLSPRASGDVPQLIAAVRQGLKDSGYVEGQNVTIEYRFAEHQNERLAALAADLVHRQVTVIVATAAPAAVAARAATTSIPIIFEMGDDPVRLGFVASLRRPGGNITGVTSLNREVAPKRLELLHELLPTVSVMALLANPTDASSAILSNNTISVAHSLGLELHVLNASTERDFDSVFADLMELRAGGSLSTPMRFWLLGANNSPRWPSATLCRRSTKTASLSQPAAWRAMEPVLATLTVSPAFTPPVFLKAKSLATCRSSRLRKLSCS